MKRWLLFALVLLLPLASASTSLHLEWELGEHTDVEHRYVEHFPDQMMQCGECNITNDGDVVVNWWRHSDTTGSDWPDDDANLRAGTNGIEIDETASLINGNGEDTRQHIVDLTGTLSVRSDYEEQYYFVANMTFTPQVELRDDALMQILFIETDATDQHGRELSFLVRDMTSDVGFFTTANNTSSVDVEVSYEHLFAAGVDLSEEAHGWRVVFVVLGAEENATGQPGVIAMYETTVPTSTEELTVLDHLPPLAMIIVAAFIIGSVIRGSLNQEHGLPEIRALWKDSAEPVVLVEILAKKKLITTEGCEAIAPWSMRGGAKRSKIEPGEASTFEVRLKKWHPQGLLILLKMDVEGLGGWTQNIRLPGRKDEERSVEDEA